MKRKRMMNCEELFKCPVCCEESALVLKGPCCGREYCGKCKGKKIACPLCRVYFKVGEKLDNFNIKTISNFDKLNKGQIQEIFAFICGEGNMEKVKYCVEEIGVDVNAKETIFESTFPLSRSIHNRHLEIVKYLVGKGANVNQARHNGITPLMKACGAEKGNLEIVKVLVQNGANINQKTSKGSFPLYYSSENGHLEIVQYLVEHGANVNKARNDEVTPLNISADKGYLSIVQYLVENGADVNKADRLKISPLFISAENGHLEIVKYLVYVRKGAYINQARYDGLTPLMISSQKGHFEIVKFLLGNGADKSLTTLGGTVGRGHTALSLCINSNPAIANLLQKK